MKLECPHCGQRLEADDEQAGEIVPCPKCNQDMTLPGPPEKSPETDLPSSGFGTCPECGAGLKVQNPVICVNCGHRFRENPQENKSGKKKKDAEAPRISPLELRMKMLLWLIPGFFGYFIAYFGSGFICFVGFFLKPLIAATIPGFLAAGWAKFLLLRAGFKTGLLAAGILFLAVGGTTLFSTWRTAVAEERAGMIRTIIDDPKAAEEYPASPFRDEVVKASIDLQNRGAGLAEFDRMAEELKLIRKLNRRSGSAFSLLEQTGIVYRYIAGHWIIFLLNLFVWNIFNFALAYSFAAIPSAFCMIPRLEIEWDADIPGPASRSGDDGYSDPMFLFYLAGVIVDVLILCVVNTFSIALMLSSWKQGLTVALLATLVLGWPGAYCFKQCEGRRLIAGLCASGVVLLYGGAIILIRIFA